MTEYHIIVMVCLLGVAGEALRLRRPGQVLLGPDWLGRYRQRSPALGSASDATMIQFLPLFPMNPTFRLLDGGGPEGLSLEPAQDELNRVLRAATMVVPLARVLLLHLVVVIPLALLTGLIPYPWYVVGGGLVAVMVPLLVEFGLAHRKLFPEQTGQRVLDILMMVFFPPAAVFAADRFAPGTLEGIHPLTAAVVLCPEDESRKMAGYYLRKWQHPLPGQSPVEAEECLVAATRLLEYRGWDLAELTCPPEPDGPASRSYCPRCQAQYLVDGGTCPDCPEVGRVGFEGEGSCS